MVKHEKGIFPCLSPLFPHSVYDEVASASRANISFEKHQYKSVAHKDAIQRLFFRGWGIAWGREEDLMKLEAAHWVLRVNMLGDRMAKKLISRFQGLQELASQAKARLEPNLVRQQLYRSRCDRCP